ncbi:hypothetical protein GCM10007269_10710 [Microbacterium murale]|uniref:Uncharacterized protein n=1 Tax=Microbacterium murale TaxID=1081040 RepID=A0ABQ1RIH5_9MICO|nr:hypothetical protein GCM10007269_10710 [Microbacterium murale]
MQRGLSSGHCTDHPPSLATIAPLMFTASSDSRNVIDAASCSAVATVGMACWNGARRADPASDMFDGIGMPVATPPGATEFTRMPLGPYMNAADFVTPMMPCLLAV